MSAAEALAFWLSGFSADSRFPISGTGGPSFLTADAEVLEERNWRYEFNLGRLAPRRDDGSFNDDAGSGRFVIYNDLRNGAERRINFWQYIPEGSEQPYVYFDVSRYQPNDYNMPASNSSLGATIFPLLKVREGLETPSNPSDVRYVNEGKYQILHAGIDDVWGDFSAFAFNSTPADGYYFPDGPFIGDTADNVSNFTDGTFEDAQE